MTGTIVIVPFRPDHGWRDQLWHFLRDHYWAPMGYEVVVGWHLGDEPFNRSKAINGAADRMWRHAIIADCDTWVPPGQLHRAVMNAKITKHLSAAFDAVVELTQPTTTDLLKGKIGLDDSFGTARVRRRDLETQSSMLVVTRELWDKVGGFDERFEGWGGEDNAFWKACSLHGGRPHRISGNAYHLWHPAADGKHAGQEYTKNLALWRRYEAAQTKEDLPC